MQLPHIAVFLAGCGLAAAAVLVPGSVSSTQVKRWDYDVCLNDCTLADIPMPDKNTFGLPLENFWLEQCPPTLVGPYNASLATSKACLTFAGTALHFDFAPFPGYTIKSAVVTWKVKGNNANSGSWSSPPPTTNLLCVPGSGGSFVCDLAFSKILQVSPTTSIPSLMGGMCPNGDREALGFYFQLSGLVEPVGGGPAIPFVQQYPCATRASDRSCTSWDTRYPYIEVAYRCTKCNVSPCPPATTTTTCPPTTEPTPPPSDTPTPHPSDTPTPTPSAPATLKTCGFGTAFGYQKPVGGNPKSFPLNTQSGQGCNRWGWYESPTLAELQTGISGPLYVGAGGNDIDKGIEVGTWVAKASPQGGVTVTYNLDPPYALAEVHVNLMCLPLKKCAPGQYTYNAGAIPNLPTWSNPTPLVYPTCSGGSKAALIVHAAVNILTVASSCPAPKTS